MPFSEYIILGPKFTLGEYRSVRIPNNWRSMSDREKVIFILELARRAGKFRLHRDKYLAWVTTPTFYEVGLNLFRNEMSVLEREGGYVVEKERIGGIRFDGKPRKWYRYRLIRTPGEKPVASNRSLFE